MRMEDPARTAAVARMAGRYADRGVVGFDLAGAERGFPATLHREALHLAHDAGLGLTCHAGEADDGHRVIETIRLGVTREQLMDALGVCVYMGGGPTLMYAAEAVRAYEEFTAGK